MPVIYVLWSLRRRGPSYIYVPNFKRKALFVQKILGGSQNFEIASRDPGNAHLRVVLCYLRRRVRPPSLYQTWSGLLNSFKSY